MGLYRVVEEILDITPIKLKNRVLFHFQVLSHLSFFDVLLFIRSKIRRQPPQSTAASSTSPSIGCAIFSFMLNEIQSAPLGLFSGGDGFSSPLLSGERKPAGSIRFSFPTLQIYKVQNTISRDNQSMEQKLKEWSEMEQRMREQRVEMMQMMSAQFTTTGQSLGTSSQAVL